MTTAAFSDVLASLTQDGDRFHVEPSEDWRQGRTLFGGLSACLAVRSAQAAFPQLPPLRSAQFAFIGPVTGALFLTPKLLRAGKSRYFHSGRGEDGDEYGFERNIGVRSRAAVEFNRTALYRCPMRPPLAPSRNLSRSLLLRLSHTNFETQIAEGAPRLQLLQNQSFWPGCATVILVLLTISPASSR